MSFSNILSVLENVDYEESEEEQWVRILQKLKQQCFKEQAKRQSLEFAIEKCKCSMRDISFAYALNEVQNKSFTSFRRISQETLKMQEKLVEKIKSCDWELVNGLWRFKIKTLREQKDKMVQQFRKQRDLLEKKMGSIPEFNDFQKTRRLFEEKQIHLLELQEQWKNRKEAVDIKYHRTNKHFQEITIDLDSSEKIVTDLKQEAETLEAEIKRLDASKLEEMRLIKDLENDLKMRVHMQTKEIAKEGNSKYCQRTRDTSVVDVFNLSPFPVLKIEKVTVKTLIEDRKQYAPMITKTPEKLYNFPKQIAENFSQSEKSQVEKIENIKLRPDKQIKILEHIVLKSAVPDTTNRTVSEQKDSSLVVRVAESLSSKTSEIVNISHQNESPSDVQDLKQSNKETDGGKLFDRQLIKQNVLYTTRMGEKADIFHTTESNTKDENKTNQAKKAEYENVLEKNISKQEELKDEEKEKEPRPKIVIEDDKFKREENAGIADLRKMSVNETKSDNVPFSKIEENQFAIDTDYSSQKLIKGGNIETDENSKFEPKEFPVNKTSSNVKKRKSDKPSTVEENLYAKQFKFKGDDSDSRSISDFKPVQPGKASVGDHSGSENDTDNILHKAFELCNVPENTDTKSGSTEINLNDDFESFFNNLTMIHFQSKDLEKSSNQSSDDVSAWAAFGNDFKIGDNNNEDKGFFK